jgi:hypothetical protein
METVHIRSTTDNHYCICFAHRMTEHSKSMIKSLQLYHTPVKQFIHSPKNKLMACNVSTLNWCIQILWTHAKQHVMMSSWQNSQNKITEASYWTSKQQYCLEMRLHPLPHPQNHSGSSNTFKLDYIHEGLSVAQAIRWTWMQAKITIGSCVPAGTTGLRLDMIISACRKAKYQTQTTTLCALPKHFDQLLS